MINAEIAQAFERIADLMEIDGGDSFRISSYRRASRTISDTNEDIAELAEQGRLQELEGIGKGMAEKIGQFLKTGRITVLDELEAKFPQELSHLLGIPGMGPKKIALVYEKLKVGSLDDLKRVIASGEMAELKGLGETSVKKIADGIAFMERSGHRTPLGVATPIAEAFLERVRKLPGVRRADLCGSLRRGLDTIGDIDIVCDAADGAAVVQHFVTLPDVHRVLAAGETKGSITVASEGQRELQIDLRVVERDAYGAALQYFTGSKEHNVRLRERAIAKKWRLNEYGLYDAAKRIAGKTEEEIYKKLGLPCFPPELREDQGEFDGQPPDLVTLDHIRGDLHMHSVASDGRCTVEEMALAAKARGYEYIAICDHSKSSVIANGLSIERILGHIDAIHAASKKMKGFEILAGCECDILPDGSLDYPDEVLAKCDWVVASVHTARGSMKVTATDRTLAAIANRYVSAIGHPTGRLINKRAPAEIDIAVIAHAAAANGTFLEINASWQRLDLKDVHARSALSAGADLVIDTDAHHTDQLDQMRFGVITARRAGATKNRVVNCLPLKDLRRRIEKKRRG